MLQKKNNVLDLLKILSMAGVVLNHLLYPVFSRTDFYLGSAWWVSLIFYTLSLVSVPLFIIINGYLLIDKKEKIYTSYNKTIQRLIIPAVFWLIFYYLWKYFYRSAWYILEDIPKVVASGSWFHYYFLIALAGLQFLLPVFRLFTKQKAKFKISVLKTFIWVGVLLHIIEYLIDPPGSINNIFSWWMPFASFFWFGYMFKQLKIPSKWTGRLVVIWATLNFLLSYLGMNIKHSNTLLGWHDSGIFYWHAFLSPNIIILSIAFFIWGMKSSWLRLFTKQTFISKTISFLAPLSYGVYLIHIFVIDWVDIRWGYAIEFISTSLSRFVVERTILVFIISYAVSFLITKTPLIKRVVGLSK